MAGAAAVWQLRFQSRPPGHRARFQLLRQAADGQSHLLAAVPRGVGPAPARRRLPPTARRVHSMAPTLPVLPERGRRYRDAMLVSMSHGTGLYCHTPEWVMHKLGSVWAWRTICLCRRRQSKVNVQAQVVPDTMPPRRWSPGSPHPQALTCKRRQLGYGARARAALERGRPLVCDRGAAHQPGGAHCTIPPALPDIGPRDTPADSAVAI